MPDYQVSAWLMAAFLNPLTPRETADLTLAMARSGERLDLGRLPRPWVDKHSTGGVGDKTTLVVLPMLAACGLTVVKMSGRGLGITGGTVDKLASVPGFRLDLSPTEMLEQAAKIGIALTGQTPSLAPADKVLYALRDVTGTVQSIPLIVSSVLSKKIAGGAETVVLDVKAGSGAFMNTTNQARELAIGLKACASLVGLNVRIAITDMDQPLGKTCGNALEVREAIDTLAWDHESRLARLCIELTAMTLEASGLVGNIELARSQAKESLKGGHALAKARQWFEAQGASAKVFDDPTSVLPQAPYTQKIFAHEEGWVGRVDAAAIGAAVVKLGGGRMRKEDSIDTSVGIEVELEVGDEVTDHELLAVIFAKRQSDAEAVAEEVRAAFQISSEPVSVPNLIHETM